MKLLNPYTNARVWMATFLIIFSGSPVTTAHAEKLIIHVAPNGNDAAKGTKRAPFATLGRARDEIRKIKKEKGPALENIEVRLASGIYQLEKPFELTQDDSGNPGNRIIYQADKGAVVRLCGGKEISGFQPVTDPAILARLDKSAHGKVCQVNLKALGITDYGKADGGGLELFFNDQPMTVSRWPNDGFVRIVDVLQINPVDVRGTKGDKAGKFNYDGDRPKNWEGEKDLWLHGYWFWDWSDSRQKVESIDTVQRIISLAPPQHSYGYRKGQWYYAFNAISEIDMPGEWCLDRETGILYFWPPKPINQSDTAVSKPRSFFCFWRPKPVARDNVVVSILTSLINMKNASNIIIRGMIMEAARNVAVSMNGGTSNEISKCIVRNIGGNAITINGGTDSGVDGCDIYDMAKAGISISGGDRTTLTPARLYANNNHIHHIGRWWRMYCGGININGVGNRATHNLIDNLPHTAIFFSGNDNLIEFNEIHSVCYESNDAGAIYAGRNWTMRGTVVRYNYLHDISGFEGRGCVGIYNDDMYCGTIMYGNVFYDVTRAAFIGGGRDCVIENNIFVDCKPAIHIDSRALGWAHECADNWIKEGTEKGTLSGIAYNKSPYNLRYPQLPKILDEDPKAPMGNLVARNICLGGKWDDLNDKLRAMVTSTNNLLNTDPLFVDAKNFNFQLKDDSPAYKLGFQKLPVEKIGLYQNKYRASWPVTSMVRPKQIPPPPPPKTAGSSGTGPSGTTKKK
ncbi:MAG: right-handed parallel beta-helix repeat-containing protein [Kiritimatiellae bacterium]|nr:right-handed parallel beta-helix repeat-containing protein [Kiritimatiellia bacterium]MDD5522611.1 right-handed parallel beta-helix repeat-containing protein [Kiritimatiellia bacterium]